MLNPRIVVGYDPQELELITARYGARAAVFIMWLYTQPDQTTEATNGTIATLLRCSDRTVKRMLAELAELRVVELVYGLHTERTIIFTPQRVPQGSGQNGPPPTGGSGQNGPNARATSADSTFCKKESLTVAAKPQPTKPENNMPFFEHNTTQATGYPTTEFDIQIATTLRTAVRALTGSSKRIHATKWAEHVARLRNDGYTTERISAAVDWLVANMRGKYTPVVRSARALREKFDAIEAAMLRAGETYELTTTGAKVYSRVVENAPWPRHTDHGRLRAAIEESLVAWGEFVVDLMDRRERERQALEEWREEHGQNKTTTKYTRAERAYAEFSMAGGAPGIIAMWYTKRGHDVAGWDEWGGTVRAMDLTDKKLRAEVRQLIRHDNLMDAVWKWVGE